MMKSKFEIGKFARRKSDGKIVEKVISNDDWASYVEDRKITGSCPMEEVDDIDVKTAFLSRLQELLATFDAEICANIGEDDATNSDKPMMWIQIGDEVVNYERGLDVCDITAENVFDYDKD